MPRLHDENSEDDWDGEDWANQYTHTEPERSIDPTLSPLRVSCELDDQGYVGDWKTIAAKKRADRSYTCERCRICLDAKLYLLHVHHLDRDKTNNDSNNLQVLCALCHSLSDGHRHIAQRIFSDDMEYIRTLQESRGKI